MDTIRIRDRLWLWGMKVNSLQESGHYAFPEQSTMTTENAIKETGITNVLMAGQLEIDRETLGSMPSARRIICKWSLHRSSKERGNYLDFDDCALRTQTTVGSRVILCDSEQYRFHWCNCQELSSIWSVGS